MTLEINHSELVTLLHVLDSRMHYCAEQKDGCQSLGMNDLAEQWQMRHDEAQALYNKVKEQAK